MAVSPQDVKKLREATGAGMLDCKKALVATDGEFKAAEKHLKPHCVSFNPGRSRNWINQFITLPPTCRKSSTYPFS